MSKALGKMLDRELQVVVDREKAASFGLTLGEIAAVLQTAIQGNVITKFSDNGTDYDIRLQLAEQNRNKISDVEPSLMSKSANRSISINRRCHQRKWACPDY